MLESVSGDEAARIFMSHLGGGSAGGARGVGWSGTGAAATSGPAAGDRGGLGLGRDRDLTALRGLDFLRHLAYRFAEYPYENISKIIKVAESESLEQAMRLPVEVVSDHIERNFGGTCFSLTFLFERVLKALGFDCYKVMADMNSGRNVHCLVVVRQGGIKYMVDPGYALYEVIPLPGRHPDADAEDVEGAGGAEAFEAGALRPGVEAGTQHDVEAAPAGHAHGRHASLRVACPHAAVEVRGEGGGVYSLLTEDASGEKWRYRFRDVPAPDAEFEEHWLESFGKPTLNNICLNRMTPRGHVYLRKDFFKFTSPTSVAKRRLTQGRERLIEQEFGIGAEWVDLAQQLLDRKLASSRGRGPAVVAKGDSAAAGACGPNAAEDTPGPANEETRGANHRG